MKQRVGVSSVGRTTGPLTRVRKTLEKTAQLGVQDFSNMTEGRQLKPIHHQLKHRRPDIEMYGDTVEGRYVSLLGNKHAMIYCTPYHQILVDQMQTKGDSHKTLDTLFRLVGVSRVLMPDNAKELTEGELKWKVSRAQSYIHFSVAVRSHSLLIYTNCYRTK